MRIAFPIVLGVCGVLTVACGDDGGSGGGADARPRPDATVVDAAQKTYCFDDLDTNCGYTPEILSMSEMAAADQLALAKKYNPAQIMTGQDVWAVSVNYLLKEGAPLRRAEHNGRINFSYDVDMSTAVNAYMMEPQPDLTATNWHALPAMSPGGKPWAYFLDAPGDNLGKTADEDPKTGQTWTIEWRRIQGYAAAGGGDPSAATYLPHQYAHLFWLSKSDNLLAVSYWFYYPYDKFANSHEGDWEHINVVLDMSDAASPVMAFVHFSWHGKQSGFLPEDLYRVADASGGDHVVVFTGGDVCIMYNDIWCGFASGASWPYPGTWKVGYDEIVAGSAGKPGRAVPYDAFNVELLPNLDEVDFDATPWLSWYGMAFLAGNPITAANDPVVQSTTNDRAPVGPGADHGEFGVGVEQSFPILRDGLPEPFVTPSGWTLSNEPPASVFPAGN